MTVVSVGPHPNPEKAHWRHVVLEENGNRQRAVCFSNTADELKPGRPLPPDWRVKQGEHGPILEAPRKPGGGFGGGGFRNSEAGLRLEQDRLDARTAATIAARTGGFDRAVADMILDWLRASR
jgi:hypothetical protein